MIYPDVRFKDLRLKPRYQTSAFLRASQKDLDAINQADLSEDSFVALAIDDIEIYGRTVVAAVGVTSEL